VYASKYLTQYLSVSSIFSLPDRKRDFLKMLDSLSEVFLECTDTSVLKKCGLTLTTLASGEHARKGEALLALKQIAQSLRDRLVDLFRDLKEDDNYDRDHLHSILLCITRMTILSKRWCLGELLCERSDSKSIDKELERLRRLICDPVSHELNIRKSVALDGESGVETSSVWASGDRQIHRLVAEIVSESLDLLLSSLAWRLLKETELGSEDMVLEESSGSEHIVIRLRVSLMALLSLCFEQFVEASEDVEVPPEQLEFADTVQEASGRTIGDMRSLFPRELQNAKSGLLRSLSLSDESHIVSGFIRFLVAKQSKVRINACTSMRFGIAFSFCFAASFE
jgi:cohesin complex subunit SA-1/2